MDKVLQVWDIIYKNSPVLAWTGGLSFVLLALFICLNQWDQRLLLGVPIWFKPIKFAISIAIFAWTVATLLNYFSYRQATKNMIGNWIAIIAVIELGVVALQAARGEASHFNISTPFDRFLFLIMGLAIFVNFIILVVLFIDTYRLKLNTSLTVKTGIRLGFLAIILGSVVGGIMSVRLQHTAGGVDGGPGILFLGWNTISGDFRIAHFLGIHGLQVIPLVGYYLHTLKTNNGPLWVMVFGIVYLLLMASTFLQAWQGYSLISFLTFIYE